jgi:uncharacterized protein (TIGR03435 family)
MRLPLFAALLALSAFAQSPASHVEFEVASVKPSADAGPARAQVGLKIDGAQLTCNYFSLREYIAMAYGLKHYQIVGPEWIASQRFDIAAKLPAGATRDQVPAMMKALLEERFQLKAHPEKKDFPVYALVTLKNGAHLKDSAPASETSTNLSVSGGGDARGTSVNLGNGSSFTFSNDKFEATRLTMQVFADSFGRFLDKPVVDQTALSGTYDFSIPVTPEDFRAMQIYSGINAGVSLPPQVVQLASSFSGDSLNPDLQKLGLRLEAKKAPLDVIVVESASKTPASN